MLHKSQRALNSDSQPTNLLCMKHERIKTRSRAAFTAYGNPSANRSRSLPKVWSINVGLLLTKQSSLRGEEEEALWIYTKMVLNCSAHAATERKQQVCFADLNMKICKKTKKNIKCQSNPKCAIVARLEKYKGKASNDWRSFFKT